MGIKSVQLPLSGLVNVVDRELAGQVDWVSASVPSHSYTLLHNIEETNNPRPKRDSKSRLQYSGAENSTFLDRQQAVLVLD